jgi:hypothetical protein
MREVKNIAKCVFVERGFIVIAFNGRIVDADGVFKLVQKAVTKIQENPKNKIELHKIEIVQRPKK